MANSLLGDIGGVVAGALTARRRKRDAELAKGDLLGVIQSLDWEPQYASELMPTYQKAKSPIARAYLESMLLGANPSQIASNTPGAAVSKRVAQMQGNQMWGTPAALRAAQVEADAETPWKVEPPTRKILEGNEKNENAVWQAGGKGMGAYGVTKQFSKALQQRWGWESEAPAAAARAVRDYGDKYNGTAKDLEEGIKNNDPQVMDFLTDLLGKPPTRQTGVVRQVR